MRVSEKVKTLVFAGVLAVAGMGMAVLPSESAYAANTKKATTSSGSSSSTQGEIENGMKAAGWDEGDQLDLESTAGRVVNVLLYIIGILAVVMIIFGGIMYTTSAGDQAKVTKAKNIILYGLVGLVVAVLAYAIVNFVLKRILGFN
ncbi:hypothetical protein IKF63_00525 [Candidatus Saccharibacteria bacterium]|nr:hypothetical protein [Candidatus Saccharibacteria bacterium]